MDGHLLPKVVEWEQIPSMIEEHREYRRDQLERQVEELLNESDDVRFVLKLLKFKEDLKGGSKDV